MDQERLDQFMGKMVGDLGAAVSAALVIVGDKLGLYKQLSEGGPQTPGELARRAGARERYVREWLNAQAASGYVDFDPATGAFRLNDRRSFRSRLL